MDWKDRRILVTGGASFISSHLIDALAANGATRIRVIDDLSSGHLQNIQPHLDRGLVEFHRADLLTPGVAEDMVSGMDTIFHLAAIHGGRGYVDLHQAACAQNLALDGMLVKAAYVGDIVSGMLLAAEKVDDGTAINLGTTERTRVIDAVKEVLRYTGRKAEIKLRSDMPTGPLNRVASNDLAKQRLGWTPQVKFMDGLHQTIDWYFKTKDPVKVRGYLERMLTGREEETPEPTVRVSAPA